MSEIINKIKKDCLEVHKLDDNNYHLVVNKFNANKVVDQLKESGAELHFNYGEQVFIDVYF